MKLIPLAMGVMAFGASAAALAQPLDVVFRLRGPLPMAALARSVEDPDSPRYGRFFTPQEIAALAGPADADYQELLARLRAAGFTITRESPTHLVVQATADDDVLARVFRVPLAVDGDEVRSAHRPLIPDELALIATVSGLDTTRHARPHLIPVKDGIPGSGPSVAQVRTLYGFDPIYAGGVNGTGQHLAIATYDDVDTGIIGSYYSLFGVTPAPTVDKVTFNGTPPKNDNSAMETAVDAEFSGALAPGARIHIFTSAHNDDGGELALFTAILDDDRIKVANYSWGDCEVHISEQHKTDMAEVFQRAVAQGVNILAASGDSGSACPTEVDANGQPTGYTDPMADWPAARPDIVAVGGTAINMASSSLSETAWSGTGAAGGGGGGISTLWALPAWQKDLGAPFVRRSYPDVAFNAAPSSGQVALVNLLGFPLPMPIGGTSIAAPQWSGFLLLVGEARAKAGKGALGYLNPILYAMTADQRRATLHDVTDGNIGAYKAGAGWDAATGWGSLNAAPMLDFLAKQ